MVPRLGVEPRYTASKAAVLPLDDLGWWSKSDSNRQPSECETDALPFRATTPGTIGEIRTRNRVSEQGSRPCVYTVFTTMAGTRRGTRTHNFLHVKQTL